MRVLWVLSYVHLVVPLTRWVSCEDTDTVASTLMSEKVRIVALHRHLDPFGSSVLLPVEEPRRRQIPLKHNSGLRINGQQRGRDNDEEETTMLHQRHATSDTALLNIVYPVHDGNDLRHRTVRALKNEREKKKGWKRDSTEDDRIVKPDNKQQQKTKKGKNDATGNRSGTEDGSEGRESTDRHDNSSVPPDDIQIENGTGSNSDGADSVENGSHVVEEEGEVDDGLTNTPTPTPTSVDNPDDIPDATSSPSTGDAGAVVADEESVPTVAPVLEDTDNPDDIPDATSSPSTADVGAVAGNEESVPTVAPVHEDIDETTPDEPEDPHSDGPNNGEETGDDIPAPEEESSGNNNSTDGSSNVDVDAFSMEGDDHENEATANPSEIAPSETPGESDDGTSTTDGNGDEHDDDPDDVARANDESSGERSDTDPSTADHHPVEAAASDDMSSNDDTTTDNPTASPTPQEDTPAPSSSSSAAGTTAAPTESGVGSPTDDGTDDNNSDPTDPPIDPPTEQQEDNGGSDGNGSDGESQGSGGNSGNNNDEDEGTDSQNDGNNDGNNNDNNPDNDKTRSPVEAPDNETPNPPPQDRPTNPRPSPQPPTEEPPTRRPEVETPTRLLPNPTPRPPTETNPTEPTPDVEREATRSPIDPPVPEPTESPEVTFEGAGEESPTTAPPTYPPAVAPVATAEPTLAPTSEPTPREGLIHLLATISPTMSMPPSESPTTSMSPAATPSPTTSPTTQLSIPLPYFRYVEWVVLSDDTRLLVERLGYTAETWNVPGTAMIESSTFDQIKQSDEPERIGYLEAMGFAKPSWDCYINHYRNYTWSELQGKGVQPYYTTLGWTEQLWADQNAPASDSVGWDQLTLDERIAAESLCYLEPIWNQDSLQNAVAWGADSVGAKAVEPSGALSQYFVCPRSILYCHLSFLVIVPWVF